MLDEQKKAQLVRNKALAEQELNTLKEAVDLEYPFFDEHLKHFIYFKYQLSPEEITSDYIADITAQSLIKTAQLSPEMAKKIEDAKNCEGLPSAVVKKSLLFMSIQNGLEIRMNATAAASSKTVTELTRAVWNDILKTPAWQERLKQTERT